MSSKPGAQYVQTSQPVSLQQEVPRDSPVSDVTIRPLQDTPEDTAFASKVMVEAFADKIAYSITKEKLPIAEKMVSTFYQGQSPRFYSRILVAELEGRRVGCLMLKFKGDTYDDSMDHLCELGCWHALRFVGMSMFSQMSVKDRKKCLVDAVGVDSWARGRGVGKILLDRAEMEARKEGCSIIYLIVLTTNRARSLYERQGYKEVGTWSFSCKCLSGPGVYYIMEKPL